MNIQMRNNRRGGALAAAMLFFVVVTVAGASLLSVSMVTQQSIIRGGYDLRLLIAAEAGVATMRGRLALVRDVQEDWAALMPNAGWNNVGTTKVNGIDVQVQAMRDTSYTAYPAARIRGIATAWDRNQVVEYTVRAPSITNHAFFSGGDLEFSGSSGHLNGGVHSNEDVKITGQNWVLESLSASGNIAIHNSTEQKLGSPSISGAPEIEMHSMHDQVPSTAEATVTLTGNQTINGYTGSHPNAEGWTIVWIRGALSIRGIVSNRVWFIVDNDITINGDLLPANENSEIRMYTAQDMHSPATSDRITGRYFAAGTLKMNGDIKILTGLFWAGVEAQFSGADIDLFGAVVSEGTVKVSGASMTTVFNPGVAIAYGQPIVIPGTWRNYGLPVTS